MNTQANFLSATENFVQSCTHAQAQVVTHML